MDDRQIIKLYNERSEAAISETADKYGTYCLHIARNILYNEQDSEECVNDTYLRAWNTIPPQQPEKLSTFLGKITRNLALDKFRFYHREKRGGGQTSLVLDELKDCVSASYTTEELVDEKLLADSISSFLFGLPEEKRQMMVRRYWYMSPVSELARDFSMSESNVTTILLRLRKKLKQHLEKEGIAV